MQKTIPNKFYDIFYCPDDYSKISLRDGFLQCSRCKRHFRFLANNFVEVLPMKFPQWDLTDSENKKAEANYFNIFSESFSWGYKRGGWGYLLNASNGYRAFVKKETKRIIELLNPSPDGIGIDVSGGVGNYSIPLSNRVKVMVHCELDVQSILRAYHQARKRDNMLFVRTPYHKIPFHSACFDCVICTDTLERGWNHEMKLLAEIIRILKEGGKAVVDFHNQRRFGKNRSLCEYAEASIKQLFSVVGIKRYAIYPFGYVPSRFVLKETFYPILNGFAKLFFPCQRYIIVFTKA